MFTDKPYSQLLFLLILLALAACTYNVEEELYPQTGCFTIDMSYQNDIIPIIEASCFPCHTAQSNDGNITLEGYDNFKIRIDNGKVIGAISHTPGFSPMPQGKPMLLDCNIEKIQAWIDDGALNN